MLIDSNNVGHCPVLHDLIDHNISQLTRFCVVTIFTLTGCKVTISKHKIIIITANSVLTVIADLEGTMPQPHNSRL